MVWPGVGISVTRSLKACALLTMSTRLAATIGSTESVTHGTGRRIVLLALGPELELAVGEYVARLGEGRHPAAVLEPRVPADVVGVQVRAHDEIDVADAEARRGQALLVTVGLHHVPERARRPRLVVADAGVDQDVVVRRLHEVALDAEHSLSLGSMNLGCSQARFSSSTSLVRVGKNLSMSKKGPSCSTMRWMVMLPSFDGVGHGVVSSPDNTALLVGEW